jgi:hypothetical protein
MRVPLVLPHAAIRHAPQRWLCWFGDYAMPPDGLLLLAVAGG